MFALLLHTSVALFQTQVPLQLYTDAQWPNGVDTGPNNGVSFADLNADGWPDFFVCQSGVVWENQGGQGWAVAANLRQELGASSFRYGSSLADFNRDGLADIASEPRKSGNDDCLHLFRNQGGWSFVDISGDRNLVDAGLCGALAETVAWADWDGDGDLDMFFPSYPISVGSIDNRFLQNLGPTGPGGAYRFSEVGQEIGLAIPGGAARPEGVVVHDLDGDGDLDLYCNGNWYRNLSKYGQPEFIALTTKASGVGKSTVVDEGTILIDYDQDGDLDLLVCYTANRGIRIWQNRGDGTFSITSKDLVEDYLNGATFGASAIDWDNDGDIDLTTLDTFRRNMLVETGVPGFELIAHDSVPEASTPGWADWDRDGDMDMAVGSATNNFLYQNTTYDASTPLAERRHVWVRVVDDAPGHPRGLETEFGAVARIDVDNAGAGRPLVQLVSSAAGYINQNEYTLHFALPADPHPSDPQADVRFDLSVDFPSLPELGFWRVGPRVNPALGNLDLALLEDRQITVFRSGKVIVNGTEYQAAQPANPALRTTTGGLVTSRPNKAMPRLELAPHTDYFVGIELDTVGATKPIRIEEILLDGELGEADFCGPGLFGNIGLWDISQAGAPQLVSAMTAQLPLENRRGHYRTDMLLQPGKVYRLVARVNSFRRSPFVRDLQPGALNVAGGLRLASTSPCSGTDFEQATLDPSGVYLAVRVQMQADRRWFDFGHGAGMPGNQPELSLSGIPSRGKVITMEINGAAPNAPIRLIAGPRLHASDESGLLIQPDPQFRLFGTTDANGHLRMSNVWPDRHRPGFPVFFQAVVTDPNSSGSAATTQLIAVIGE